MQAGSATGIVIRTAAFPEDGAMTRSLFVEYAAGLGIDLSFQDFAGELAALPGDYAPPGGALLLATADGDVLGCGAIRPLEDDCCEMKRLYVRPAARGRGAGARLVATLCVAARAGGYRRMRLDTLASLLPALRLYRAAGFREIPPYTFNPLPGARFLELDLGAAPGAAR